MTNCKSYQPFGVVCKHQEIKYLLVDLCVSLELDTQDVEDNILREPGRYNCVFINYKDGNYYLDGVHNASGFNIEEVSVQEFISRIKMIAKAKKEEIRIGEHKVEFFDTYLRVGCQTVDYQTVEKIWEVVSSKLNLDEEN